jgi:catechol 2,3-dioxygenase-like lactoylglutathione lyase family enzyme
MTIQRIEALLYGADDVAASARFFADWGLEKVESGAAGAILRTPENQFVHIRAMDDPALPASPEGGATLYETVWGVDGKAGLEAVGAELSSDRDVAVDTDGTLRTTDETGFSIAFRPADRTDLEFDVPQYNVGDVTPRMNRPIDPDMRARPLRIGHVVFTIPKQGAAEACAFYRERLNFRLSDRAMDTGDFMRCEGALDHHSLFLAHRMDKAAFGHAAFELGGFDEIMLGGKYMAKQGWDTRTRPGRHIMGSNLFWYFKCPCGGATEYFADMDRLDDDWEPRIFEENPGYAMWMLEDA